MRLACLALMLFAGAAGAQMLSPPIEVPKGDIMAPPLPPPAANPKPLPELEGVVSWRTLKQVEMVKLKDKFVPQFSDAVVALDKKEVTLRGFMMPLSAGEQQSHFILAALPPTCAFCLPGGPDSIVEVKSKTPVKYTFEPVTVTGRFALIKDDPMGLMYRLTEARAGAK
ncbi:MAG TPA: DUF3299 domain-containing protein [Pelomicrobium sp.]|nr:DUF3299 domain-containing protein [Pelomicrobium sp.]